MTADRGGAGITYCFLQGRRYRGPDEISDRVSHGECRRNLDFLPGGGPPDGPTLLLLHGLPSSSRMFEPLFTRLSDHVRLIAPDYPGFGHSDWPDPKSFAYTFDHCADVMNRFTEAIELSRYTLYMQDYGACKREPCVRSVLCC